MRRKHTITDVPLTMHWPSKKCAIFENDVDVLLHRLEAPILVLKDLKSKKVHRRWEKTRTKEQKCPSGTLWVDHRPTIWRPYPQHQKKEGKCCETLFLFYKRKLFLNVFFSTTIDPTTMVLSKEDQNGKKMRIFNLPEPIRIIAGAEEVEAAASETIVEAVVSAEAAIETVMIEDFEAVIVEALTEEEAVDSIETVAVSAIVEVEASTETEGAMEIVEVSEIAEALIEIVMADSKEDPHLLLVPVCNSKLGQVLHQK